MKRDNVMVRLLSSIILTMSLTMVMIPEGTIAAPTRSSPVSTSIDCPAAVPNALRFVRSHGRSPLRRRSNDAVAVRRLYRLTCSLPVVQGSYLAYHCAADNGVTYHLTYFRGPKRLLEVTAKASGCEWLFVGGSTYRGPHAYWLTAGFWTALSHVVHVPAGTLTPRPTPTIPDVTVTVPPFVQQPVVQHVSQDLTLSIPSVSSPTGPGPGWLVHTDPHYLTLLTSGPAGSRYIYRWEAVARGDAIIVLDPLCLPHGCAAPSLAIRVTILA